MHCQRCVMGEGEVDSLKILFAALAAHGQRQLPACVPAYVDWTMCLLLGRNIGSQVGETGACRHAHSVISARGQASPARPTGGPVERREERGVGGGGGVTTSVGISCQGRILQSPCFCDAAHDGLDNRGSRMDGGTGGWATKCFAGSARSPFKSGAGQPATKRWLVTCVGRGHEPTGQEPNEGFQAGLCACMCVCITHTHTCIHSTPHTRAYLQQADLLDCFPSYTHTRMLQRQRRRGGAREKSICVRWMDGYVV